MSIWERISQAIAALANGESLSDVFAHLKSPPERTIGFTIAVIALGAKMAKADGQVTKDEVSAFRQVFHIPEHEEANAARVFNLARSDVAGFDGYAKQITNLFGQGDPMLVDVLDGLFQIAMADGVYHPGEDALLKQAAEIFGVSERCFRSLRARYAPDSSDPFDVLGVEPDDSPAEIRTRWRQLVRETHPDRMIARGLPEEAIKLATKKLSEINEAYETITTKQAA
jgi:DnaJ like chaperone protein